MDPPSPSVSDRVWEVASSPRNLCEVGLQPWGQGEQQPGPWSLQHHLSVGGTPGPADGEPWGMGPLPLWPSGICPGGKGPSGPGLEWGVRWRDGTVGGCGGSGMASSGWALRVLGVRGGGGGPGSASSPQQPLGVWQRPRGHPVWDSVCGLTGKASPGGSQARISDAESGSWGCRPAGKVHPWPPKATGSLLSSVPFSWPGDRTQAGLQLRVWFRH